MKFVFLKSGDSLEFKPSPANIVSSWFKFQFDNECNTFSNTYSTTNAINENIDELNRCIDLANTFIASFSSENFKFKKSNELDQSWLSQCHKQWAFLTDRYKNDIFPAPEFWHNINHLIHRLEGYYSTQFTIDNSPHFKLPIDYTASINPEDGIYTTSGLILSYCNLGRTQYEQWLINSDIDNETNNYRDVPLRFEYHCSMHTGPSEDIGSNAPIEYIDWCNKRNIPVIAPYIPLGKFLNIDKYEVRKIMHRNLTAGSLMSFEL